MLFLLFGHQLLITSFRFLMVGMGPFFLIFIGFVLALRRHVKPEPASVQQCTVSLGRRRESAALLGLYLLIMFDLLSRFLLLRCKKRLAQLILIHFLLNQLLCLFTRQLIFRQRIEYFVDTGGSFLRSIVDHFALSSSNHTPHDGGLDDADAAVDVVILDSGD